ncbi:hypothetical protein AVEN_90543-1 [Araneus ventricosus]|uniref:Uncharacterized protein n=1 Tax=Araneus ventricosus TaxID=182803 RepID=A0A4Y2MG93_ARAVE|nr:hypothetical protein AVEN_90543-1 [Araneus ventricosus]
MHGETQSTDPSEREKATLLARTVKRFCPSSFFLIAKVLAVPSLATRGLFCYGPRNFEPQSDDEDDTRASTSTSPNFRITPEWRRVFERDCITNSQTIRRNANQRVEAGPCFALSVTALSCQKNDRDQLLQILY